MNGEKRKDVTLKLLTLCTCTSLSFNEFDFLKESFPIQYIYFFSYDKDARGWTLVTPKKDKPSGSFVMIGLDDFMRKVLDEDTQPKSIYLF